MIKNVVSSGGISINISAQTRNGTAYPNRTHAIVYTPQSLSAFLDSAAVDASKNAVHSE